MNIASATGDVREAEFEQLMRTYETEVLRVCFLCLADRGMAEDALQDTFTKVWRSMDRFEQRNDCSVKTWIMRIAVNTCRDYRRSSWFRHRSATRSLEDLPPALTPVSQDSRELFLDVLGLPEKYRHVILLYHYQGMTAEEVASALGISRPTVSRCLKKAYALLRSEQGEEDRI